MDNGKHEQSSLFKRASLRFDDEEVDEHELERDPCAVHNVVLPANRSESNRVDVLIEDKRRRYRKAKEREALSSEGER